MKNLSLSKLAALLSLGAAVTAGNSTGQTIYSQATTFACATGTNLVEKSASTLTVATFRTDVATGWTNNSGGVFDIPTAVVTGTTVFRGSYGKDSIKRMQMTSSVSMQNSTSGGGTIYALSGANVATSSANQSDYNMALGLFDVTSGLPLSGETITEIGFVIPSKTSAVWPLDILATATFTDGTTQAFRTNISNVRGADDTFYGFVAPSGQGITNIHFQSYSPGTTNLVADRISWDDFGFVTGPYAVVAQPQIINVSPAAYAVYNPTNVIQFNALTYVSVPTNNISVILNSNNVSGQLVFSGSPTNYLVTYTGLLPNKTNTLTISVTNSGGVTTSTRTFYTLTNATTWFDSGGFTDNTLYPIGNLLNFTNGGYYWTPNTNEPAQIMDIGSPQGKILQRQNTGATRFDYLNYPQVSSGILIFDFDAFVSITNGRTLDIVDQPVSSGTTIGMALAWGELPGKLAYYDNTNWNAIADLPTTWHHVTITNYLSGAVGGTYDVVLNGTTVASKIKWRNTTAGTNFGSFRIESVNTSPLFEYGNIDNLVITVSPENATALPAPVITNVAPYNYAIAKATNGIQIPVVSYLPVAASNVTLLLNSNDVSSQVTVSASATNYVISYSNLLANQTYTMQVTVSNATGVTSFTNTFYTYTSDFVVFDAGGFTDNTLYPLGPLMNVTNQYGYWVPAVTTPAQIVDTGDPAHGKVLERSQAGNEQVDNAKFIPIGSGTITINFDARVSNPANRTLDVSLQNDGAVMSSFIILATNTIYYATPSGALISVGSLTDTNWHHYTLTTYLSGSSSNTFDFTMDSNQLVTGAAWRSTTLTARNTPLVEIRVGSIRGVLNDFADVDNFIVTAGPDRVSATRVTLTNPLAGPTTFRFSFLSQNGITYAAQYESDLKANNWTTFQTITGDGTLKTVIHTNTPVPALFYRVKTQ